MAGMDQVISTGRSSNDSMAMTPNDIGSGEPAALTLELLIGPTGLPMQYLSLVEGMGVVESTLFSPEGEVMWSTETHGPDQPSRSNLQLNKAEDGTISSLLLKDWEIVNRDGTVDTIDVVQTYVPLRDSPTSPVVAVLEFNREFGTDLGRLVDGTKSTVVWTTVVTMAGLFLALLGFVVVSDRMIYRSNQKQLAMVKDRLTERDRARRELRKVREQVAASEKMAAIGQMSAGVAHDMRNPLGAIKNATYMMNKRLTTDGAIDANPKLGRYLEIIDKQIGRSNQIITDLMTFARVGSPAPTETHLDSVLAESLETMTKNDNIELSQHVDPELPTVMADGDQLQRVFLNLANNAQEAMPKGGQLTITLRSVDEDVEIIFADTGNGISDENIENVFEPLFTTKTKGTGLGLAVCQEIVVRHGGTISLRRNVAAPSGTIFEVRLPAAVQQQEPQGETPNDA